MLWFASPALANPLVAVVVVDQAARDEGYALELEDLVVEDALPVDVAEGEQVRIVDPDGGRHPLDVAPGEAWEVSGPSGEAWMSRLGEDVRTDVLVVRGDEDAVRALATALHAELHAEDGQFVLTRPGVLFDAPWAEADGLSRVDEVRLVRVHPDEEPARVLPARPAPVAAPVAAPVVAPAAPPRVTPAVVAAPVVAIAPAPAVTPAAAPVDRGSAGDAPPDPPSDAVAAPVVDRTAALDPTPYLGLYICGDGTPILLSPGGFSYPGASGDWYVSAPGVVHLDSAGGTARAAIEVDRHYCRAVW